MDSAEVTRSAFLVAHFATGGVQAMRGVAQTSGVAQPEESPVHTHTWHPSSGPFSRIQECGCGATTFGNEVYDHVDRKTPGHP